MKRAGTEEQKSQRRREILDYAGNLLGTRDFEDVKLAEVAQGLGLVKGTLYRYFPTKEALVLEVLEDELEGWLLDLSVALADGKVLTTSSLAKSLASGLSARPLLVRLFSIVHVQLEKNLSLERLVEFKRRTLKVLGSAASLVEASCPALSGQGTSAVLGIYELAIGVGHLTGNSPLVRQALQTPGLEAFQLRFEAELESSLRWLLTGLGAPDSERGRSS